MPCYVKVRLQVDPLVSSSDLGEDPQQVPRDPLGTAFGAERDLGTLFCLGYFWLSRASFPVCTFVGSGAEETKDGRESNREEKSRGS